MRILRFAQRFLVVALSIMTGASLLAAAAATHIHASSRATPSTVQDVDTYVHEQMQRQHIPGLALGIVHGDQTVHLQGFGSADAAGRPVTPQTPFVLGSVSKSFTASAVMQLVEQGKIELDAPVQRYLPWFRVATPGASSQMTVRHLLNQTSGLPTSAGYPALSATSDTAMEQLVRGLSSVTLTAPIGTQFNYCNANYVTLGLIVQTVTHESFGSYIQRTLLAPLRMRHSFTSQSEAERHGLATGHIWLFGAPFPMDEPQSQGLLPEGSLISSAEDMTHYLTMQLNQGRYLDTQMLSPMSVNTMHSPTGIPANIPGTSYGMGWYADSVGNQSVVYHGGNTPNFETYMLLAPSSLWGVVILTNKESLFVGDPGDIAQGVLNILQGKRLATPVSSDLVYLIIDSIVVALTALAIWSLTRVLRRRRPVGRRFSSILWRLITPLVWELALPLAILLGFPSLQGGSWSVILLYLPDLGSWALAFSILLLVTGALRWALALRSLSPSSETPLQTAKRPHRSAVPMP